jgi:hypothetical protein
MMARDRPNGPVAFESIKTSFFKVRVYVEGFCMSRIFEYIIGGMVPKMIWRSATTFIIVAEGKTANFS